LEINPGSGEGLERNVKELLRLDPALVARLKEILKYVARWLHQLRKSRKNQTSTSRLSCFLFRSSRTGTFNSTPQLLARDRRAVAQGAQLAPGDLRMDAAG